MIKRVKSIVVENRTLFENFSFLSLLQISNLLIFILIIPYLFRVLGKENYGLVVFAQTIAIYFSIIVNFGFNVTATRDISIYRHDINKVSHIISSILSLKIFFFLTSVVILSFLVISIPLFHAHPKIFFFSMLFCLSEALFPIWYFQGIEKMKYITFINVTTRIVSAILIIVFVKQPNDYLFVPLFLGMGTVLGSVIGLYIVFKIYKNNFILLSISHLRGYTKENIPLFLSNVSSQIYVNANKLIVGSFLGMNEVAIYDVAEKIINLIKVPISLVGQTLFPRVSRDKNVKFVKLAMVIVSIFFVIVYAGVLLFAHPIMELFSGVNDPVSSSLLRVLGISLLPICLGLFYAELILVPFGYLRDYSKMRVFSVLLYLLIVGFLITINEIGLFQLAIAIIIVELFVFLYSLFLCKKNKLI